MARALNLSYASDDRFIMRGDYTSRVSSYDKGRKSVRLLSKKSYSHGTVMVADVTHMPTGCGTWPALWSVGESKLSRCPLVQYTNTIQTGLVSNFQLILCNLLTPQDGGEIDLIEGVNDRTPNLISLHSSENCQQPSVRRQKG